MQGVHLRKYGESATINFDLFEVDGVDFRVDAVHATGDSTIMKDEGAEANTSNAFTDEGNGYSIVLTATEMQAARIVLYLVDQTATKAWLDKSIVIETYGHASAQHAFDLDTATQSVSLAAGAVNNASLAGNMEIVFETDFATNYNTTRNAWATNAQDFVGTSAADPFNGQVVAASVTGDTKQTADVATLITTVGAAGAGLTALATQASVNTIDGNVDAILVDTGTTLQAELDAIQAAVITNAAGADIAADIIAIKAETANIVADTNELQTDNVPGLIAALNDISTAEVNTEVDTALSDIHLDHLLAADYDPASKPGTATALLNELIESDSGVSRFTANALEQAPSGTGASAASIRAEMDSNSTQLAAIVADTNELQTDWANGGRLDLILDTAAAGGGSSPQLLQTTTISGTGFVGQTTWRLVAGSADDDAYNNQMVIITDSATSTQKAIALISDYVGSTKEITLADDPGIFTMAAGDTVDIIAVSGSSIALQLDASGYAELPTATQTSIDNIEGDTNELQTDLTNGGRLDLLIDSILADTGELQTNQGNWLTVTGHATEAKQDVIDGIVDAILVDTGTTLPATLVTIDGLIDAIKAVTDLIPDSGAMSSIATASALATVDTVVDGIQTDLSNGTDGLGALKTLIDAVNTDLSNGTDGLGALKALIDTLDGVADGIKAKTDSLTFTVAGQVDSNVQSINDVTITGDGGATPYDVA